MVHVKQGKNLMRNQLNQDQAKTKGAINLLQLDSITKLLLSVFSKMCPKMHIQNLHFHILQIQKKIKKNVSIGHEYPHSPPKKVKIMSKVK